MQPIDKIDGAEIVKIADGTLIPSLLGSYIKKDEPFGIDGKMRAGILLGLINERAAAGFIDIVPVIDSLRSIKNEDEILKLRGSFYS